MKLDELIDRLQALRHSYGNIEVLANPQTNYFGYLETDGIIGYDVVGTDAYIRSAGDVYAQILFELTE